jgi:hypothetical protein
LFKKKYKEKVDTTNCLKLRRTGYHRISILSDKTAAKLTPSQTQRKTHTYCTVLNFNQSYEEIYQSGIPNAKSSMDATQ